MNKQSYLFTVTGTYLWAVVAESAGVVGFYNKNRIVQRREEPVYLHFLEKLYAKLLRRLCIQQSYDRCWCNKVTKEGRDKLS